MRKAAKCRAMQTRTVAGFTRTSAMGAAPLVSRHYIKWWGCSCDLNIVLFLLDISSLHCLKERMNMQQIFSVVMFFALKGQSQQAMKWVE